MLDLNEADQIVEKAASDALGTVGVSRVLTERTADSDGNEALAVTIVIKRGCGDRLTGELAGNAILGMLQALQASGDDRFPITSFATEEEMEAGDDPEC